MAPRRPSTPPRPPWTTRAEPWEPTFRSGRWGRTWCAGCATARGVLRLDRRASGGEAVETSFLFAYPNRWRIADAGGAVVWIDDGEQEWTRNGADEPMRHRRHGLRSTPVYGLGHPGAMLGEAPRVHATRYSYGAPAAPGRAVTVAGRLCWEFALEPHAEDPVDPDGPGVCAPPPAMTVAFDDATGIALRLDLAGAELAELVEFEPDVDVPDDAFRWGRPRRPALAMVGGGGGGGGGRRHRPRRGDHGPAADTPRFRHPDPAVVAERPARGRRPRGPRHRGVQRDAGGRGVAGARAVAPRRRTAPAVPAARQRPPAPVDGRRMAVGAERPGAASRRRSSRGWSPRSSSRPGSRRDPHLAAAARTARGAAPADDARRPALRRPAREPGLRGDRGARALPLRGAVAVARRGRPRAAAPRGRRLGLLARRALLPRGNRAAPEGHPLPGRTSRRAPAAAVRRADRVRRHAR